MASSSDDDGPPPLVEVPVQPVAPPSDSDDEGPPSLYDLPPTGAPPRRPARDNDEETESSVSSDEPPELQDQNAPESEAAKSSRAEKKARKAISKLGGFTELKGVTRVVLGKNETQMYAITKPTVMKSEPADGSGATYVIFGNATLEQPGQHKLDQALNMQQRGGGGGSFSRMGGGLPPRVPPPSQPQQRPRVEEEEEEVDMQGVVQADLDLVLTQAGCSRAKAAQALRDANGDVVTAIMGLTI